jgi:hypothetical protein
MTDEAIPPASQPDAAPVPQDADTATAAPDQSVKPEPNVTANGERLDRQTRNWRALERDRDHWREMAMRQQAPQPTPGKPEAPPAKKTLADFDFDEGKFQEHLLEQATARATDAAEKRLRESREQEARQQRESQFASREAKYAETVEDYFEITRDPRVPVTREMMEAIAESENGPELAYHLAKNLSVAERIARMSPIAQARELGKLEATLANERAKAEEAKKRVSQAPPPPPKIDGSDPKVDKDPSDMSDTEFAKWRRKQIAARR